MASQRPKDLAEASLEELMNIEVYSASKHLQSASEAPSSVAVVTADETQLYGSRTLADLLRSVRSFYLTYDRNNSPAHLDKLNLGLPLFRSSLFAVVDAQYISARWSRVSTRVVGFPEVNSNLPGRNLGGHTDISAGIYNFLDQQYFDPGAADLTPTAIQQDGRSFRVKLTFSWGGQK